MSNRTALFGMFAFAFAFVALVGGRCFGQNLTTVYKISHLPSAWTRNAVGELEFDPSFVVEAIKRKIDNGSWENGACISIHSSSQSLVICQDRSGHRKIADLIDDLTPRKCRRP